MLEPYKMVLVSLIASSILGLGLFTYKYIYPKRNIPLLLVLILISMLPLISILRKGSYESGDLSMHGIFATSFYNSLKEGIIIPHWAQEMYFGYGYPLFIFIYPLPYYIISSFHFIGFPFIESVKLLLALTFIFSGVFMYIWTKNKFGKIPAFVISLFYLFSPYHLVDMHFRVSIGEMTAFMLIPLCFIFSEKVIKENNSKWKMSLTVTLALIILSHQAISLVLFPFLAIYIFFLYKKQDKQNLSKIINYYLPFLEAVLLTSFYWLPMALESKYTLLSTQALEFPPLKDFLYSSWRAGFLFQGPRGELSYIIGYGQIGIVISSIMFLFKKIGNKQDIFYIKFFLFSFLVIFILMQAVTKPLWEIIPILRNFQFSSRLLVFTSFSSSVLAGIIIKQINKNWLIFCVSLLVVSTTILNWGNRRNIPSIDDAYLKSQLPYVIGTGGNLAEASTIWLDYEQLNINHLETSRMEIISGSANITTLKINPIAHDYSINTSENSYFREDTLYFPGWTLKVDNKNYPFEYKNPNYPGIIFFSLPKGNYRVELIFKDIAVVNFSKMVSLLSLFSILIIVIGKRLTYFQRSSDK